MEYKPLKIGNLTARLPLVQGGMGVGISLSRLAGAVAKEGGIGIISTAQIGFRRAEFDNQPIEANLAAIPEELAAARAIAPEGVIGFNIMAATKHCEEYVRAAAKAGADIIISGAGLPVDFPRYIKGFSTKLAPIVSSVKAAALICKLWDRRYQVAPDMVVIEGPEAGGHLGFSEEEAKSLTKKDFEAEILKIIEEVKKFAVKYDKEIPVIVAGGIYDGEDVRYVIEDLAADGVQVSTRFVTTEECDAPLSYKQAYLTAGKDDIIITKSPVGMPGRAIKNAFLEKLEKGSRRVTKCHQCLEKCQPQNIPYCITDALVNAARGNVEEALLFCGSNAYRSQEMETVPAVINDLFPAAL
mgnify:CR=1 FL=1